MLTLAAVTNTDNVQHFEFNQAAFWPLDGQLLGTSNPGANNRYFTMEVGRAACSLIICAYQRAVDAA